MNQNTHDKPPYYGPPAKNFELPRIGNLTLQEWQIAELAQMVKAGNPAIVANRTPGWSKD